VTTPVTQTPKLTSTKVVTSTGPYTVCHAKLWLALAYLRDSASGNGGKPAPRADPRTNVRIRIDIEAEDARGFSETTVRAAKENGRHLGVKTDFD